MQFALHYRGELRPSGKAKAEDKHLIRRHFHPQLKKLWKDKDSPLRYYSRKPDHADAFRKMGPFQFAPFVSRQNNLLAELEIMLLRPEAPGGILVQHGGDIDNRLKTLFDAMTVPSQQQALPPDAKPGDGEQPFFCVLDDDRLITKLAIHTERLWEDVKSPNDVELIVVVRPIRKYDMY